MWHEYENLFCKISTSSLQHSNLHVNIIMNMITKIILPTFDFALVLHTQFNFRIEFTDAPESDVPFACLALLRWAKTNKKQ